MQTSHGPWKKTCFLLDIWMTVRSSTLSAPCWFLVWESQVKRVDLVPLCLWWFVPKKSNPNGQWWVGVSPARLRPHLPPTPWRTFDPMVGLMNQTFTAVWRPAIFHFESWKWLKRTLALTVVLYERSYASCWLLEWDGVIWCASIWRFFKAHEQGLQISWNSKNQSMVRWRLTSAVQYS